MERFKFDASLVTSCVDVLLDREIVQIEVMLSQRTKLEPR